MRTLKKILILFIISLSLYIRAFSQDIIFDWKYTTSNGYSEGKCIATDSAGYVYVGGIINGTTTFLDTTINATGSYNSFVAKLTPAGSLVWFKWFQSSYCRLSSICFDKENKFYVAGTYGGSFSVVGDTTLQGNNSNTSVTNMFIIKYDTAGVMQWAKNTTGLYYTIGNGAMPCKKITVDNDNNLIVTGRCIDALQYFDTTVTVPVSSPETGFLAKYNSSGQKLWVKKIGGVNCYPYAVKTDNVNNIIVTGNFADSVTFDTINILTGYSNCDNVFITKYYSNGTACWAQRAAYGGTVDNAGYDIAVDLFNNIYLTGSYGDIGEFGGILFFYGGYTSEGFLAKYNTNGLVAWAVPIGTSHSSGGVTHNFSVSVSIKDSKIYLFGTFMDTMSFNNIHLNSSFDNATFLLKLDLDGNIIKAGQYLEPQAYIWADELTIDRNSNIYITGFKQTPGNIFIAKLNDSLPISVNISNELINQNNVSIFPNPTNGIIYIQSGLNSIEINIFDVAGKEVSNYKQLNKSINLTDLQTGVYLIKIKYQKFTITKKIVKY